MLTPFCYIGGDIMGAILDIVQTYIDSNIYNSAVWDDLEDKMKLKAINNAYRLLVSALPDIYSKTTIDTIDLDDLVAEIMWIIKKDDSTDRADQGATMITLGDMSLQFDSNRTGVIIAPEIISKYGLATTGQKRRIGSYVLPIQDTARTGLYQGNKRRFRYE